MKVCTALKLGVTLAVSLAAAVASAQGPGSGMGLGMGPGMGQGPGGPGFGMHRPPMERAMRGEHGRWWNNPDIVAKLKLTDEQRKAMDDIFQQHREKLVDLRGNVEKAEIAMEPLVRADQPNETAVLAQIDKVAQARAELEKANARFLFALRAKLTPEQWKQVQDFRQNRGAMRGRWGGSQGSGPASSGDKSAPAPPPGPQSMLGGPGEENFVQGANQ